MLTQPRETAMVEEKRRDDRCRVEDDAPLHLPLRAQETAAVTSCSSMPNCSSRALTSPARLLSSGRRTMHSPSVLTSKYSTPWKRLTTVFGRVIWFFDVFFASISLF